VSKRIIGKNLVPKDDIVGMCVSSQWSGVVAVDKNGNHLMNAIIWMDSRGAPYIQKKMGGPIKISGYSVFTMLKWIKTTGGGPGLAGKDPISHILYLKNEKPEIYNNTYNFLECKDYLNLKLTGKFYATYDSIGLFWVTNNKDINNIHYDDKLIKFMGLERNKLPPLIGATDIVGNLSKDVADQIGLNYDVKVVAGSPDLQSAAVGSGATRFYEGHIYIGTSSWVICHVPFKKTDIFHNFASVPSAIPGSYFIADEQETAGGCLSFLKNNIIYNKDLMLSETKMDNVYQIFDEIIAKVPAGSHNLIFTPWLYGERTPIEDHTIRGGMHNITLSTTSSDMLRAVYEGVAYNSRWVLKYVEKFIKRKMDPINIIGGGALSDEWCQIYADILDRTMRRVKDPIQANARGAAFIGSVGLGYITFEDIHKYIQISKVFTPNPANRQKYDALFKEFVNIYKSTAKIYKRLAKIPK
jgi:xylulokinase